MKSESVPLRAQFFRGNRLNFAMALLASLLTAGLNLLIARVLQQMIDAVSIVPGAPGLGELALDIGLIFVLIAALKALEYYAKPRFLERAMRQYKGRAFELLTQKSIAAFSGEDSAVYLSAFSNDAASVERGCLEGLFSLASNAVLALGALAMMLAYSPLLTVISCAFFALPIAASLAAGDRVERAERSVSDLNGELTASLRDSLGGFSVIKSFKAEAAMAALFSRGNAGVERAKCRKRRLVTLIGALGSLAGVTAQLGVFFVGAWLALSGRGITPGVLIVFITLTAYVITPISEFPEQLAAIKAGLALTDKLSAALSDNVRGGGSLPADLGQGIELRHVSFGYEPGCEVLHDITASFRPGECCAVVGASGSGKSTLLRLLMASHADYSGEIRLGGHELRELSSESLYDLVSVIEQNVFVFNASIRDNITMFSPFPEAEVERAIELSGLSALVAERGGDYLCGENGSSLSGGEGQRISIARSLLRRSEVLLVDEATAALDAATAYQVTDAILSLEGMTRILVTHSLDAALLRRCDRILALRGGRIVESGTFDELMSRRGYFYSLYTVSQ